MPVYARQYVYKAMNVYFKIMKSTSLLMEQGTRTGKTHVILAVSQLPKGCLEPTINGASSQHAYLQSIPHRSYRPRS